MKINIIDCKTDECVCDALILPVTEDNSVQYKGLNGSLQAIIKKLFSKEFKGKQNEVILIPAPSDIKPERILLIGLGKKEGINAEKVRQAGGKASSHLRISNMKNVAFSTEVLDLLNISPSYFIEGALLGIYNFSRYKKEDDNKKTLDSLTVIAKPSKTLADDIRRIEIITDAVYFARDMVNTPANDMTPTHLARTALALKKKRSISVKVLERGDAEKLGMGAYLSVAKGSKEPPKFIILQYKGAEQAPLVLIGKSITFDSGGISIKPSEGMEKMKYDMAGGAAVLGIMKAVSELKLPIHLVGILPATENLPGGTASRPGDIVKSIEGKTIEIINTDAEGRLVIADAIGYSKRYKPLVIIDIATLTGACSIALGNEAIAMFGNNREWLDRFKRSSEETYERVWEMPLYEEYKEYIKSDVADIKNTGGKTGSLVTSAYFLSEFAGQTPWVHLDIASTAWVEKDKPYIPKGASGVGIRLIMNIIKDLL